MSGVALSAAGAEISMVTSFDENFPPENILDGNTGTFWTSTGLFPQELIISFRSVKSLTTINVSCSSVKRLAVYVSSEEEPVTFEKVGEKDLEHVDGLQTDEFSFKKSHQVRHLRLVILSGFDHFVSIHNVEVNG